MVQESSTGTCGSPGGIPRPHRGKGSEPVGRGEEALPHPAPRAFPWQGSRSRNTAPFMHWGITETLPYTLLPSSSKPIWLLQLCTSQGGQAAQSLPRLAGCILKRSQKIIVSLPNDIAGECSLHHKALSCCTALLPAVPAAHLQPCWEKS